jgi:hypothetical protein
MDSTGLKKRPSEGGAETGKVLPNLCRRSQYSSKTRHPQKWFPTKPARRTLLVAGFTDPRLAYPTDAYA